MATRVIFEVREPLPGYYTYDVEVHPEGHRANRQASGAFWCEQKAEQAAELAIGALQVHLVGLGFEPLPVERRGLSPRDRRRRRVAHWLGFAAAVAAVCSLLVTGLALIASAIW